MVSTRVGYAGGTTLDPTYRAIGDHTESVEIRYDPNIISYEELLEIFWSAHNPTARPFSEQYRALLFYLNEEQRIAAEKSFKQQQAGAGDMEIYTRLVPLNRFYEAENYHQKYALKNNPELFGELKRYYSDEQKLTGSTAAARINGYLSGYGTKEELQSEIESFGLTDTGEEKLLRFVR